MSQYSVVHHHTNTRFVFGWDQPLQSFYLQVQNLIRGDGEDYYLVDTWLGADKDNIMYEVDDLVTAAHKHGLDIPHETQVKLYREKDDGV